jgi:hypothetical protein
MKSLWRAFYVPFVVLLLLPMRCCREHFWKVVFLVRPMGPRVLVIIIYACLVPKTFHIPNLKRIEMVVTISKQDVFLKHKCPREWQISLTAMSSSKLLKKKSNAKVTSNHLFHYSSDIISHGNVLSHGTVTRNIQVLVYTYSKVITEGKIFNM